MPTANAWNAQNLPGTPVSYRPVPLLPFRRPARTAGRAFTDRGTAKVNLIGYARPVPVNRVTPIPEAAPCNTP